MKTVKTTFSIFEVNLAERILVPLISSANMVAVLEDKQAPSPNKIAVMACDIAQAFINECESREWLKRELKEEAHAGEPA